MTLKQTVVGLLLAVALGVFYGACVCVITTARSARTWYLEEAAVRSSASRGCSLQVRVGSADLQEVKRFLYEWETTDRSGIPDVVAKWTPVFSAHEKLPARMLLECLHRDFFNRLHRAISAELAVCKNNSDCTFAVLSRNIRY